MELIQVGDKTYYIKNATNIGIYKVDDKNVYLIDSGNDKDAGRKILKIIDSMGWNIVGIINTHSNADHIGGNKIIQDRTGCKILANNIEKSFIENPILEASFLYGGYPFRDIRNKFLMAKESSVSGLEELPKGLEYINLKGHFFDMIGIKTSDNIYFLGDALFSLDTINKYHLFYIYDVKEFLNTLEMLDTIDAVMYIPSHVNATNNIKDLINVNRNKVIEVSNKILEICRGGKTFEEILREIFIEYNLVMNANEYVLVGSTIRSYLAYLCDENRISYKFVDNKMIWE